MAEDKTQADHKQHGKHDGQITGKQKQIAQPAALARLIGKQMARENFADTCFSPDAAKTRKGAE